MISVVICTYNRVDVLARTLESFAAQEGLGRVDHELLVVDNNSTDGTRQVVDGAGGLHGARHVFEPVQGLSAARNRAVRESRGDTIAFLDDDVIVDAQWLLRLAACIDETGAVVVGGRSYLVFDGAAPAWLGPAFRVQLSEVDLGEERLRLTLDNAHRIAGLNLAFRADRLRALGGFDEALGRKGAGLMAGEETSLVRQLVEAGEPVVYEPSVVVGHIIAPERLEWVYFRRLAYSLGKTAARREARRSRVAQFASAVRFTFRALVQAPRLTWRCFFAEGAYQRHLAKSRQWSKLGRTLGMWGRLLDMRQ